MGLNTKAESNKQIVMIKHGGLCLESKDPKEGYFKKDDIQIPNTDRGDGQPETMTKYIKVFRSLDGYVKGLEWYNTEDKYSQPYLGVKVHMEDEGEEYILDIPYQRRQFNTFCKFVENIDFTDRVEFYVSKDQSDNTKFGANQNGTGIKWKYTMASMGDCPLGKQNKNTKKWDFSAQNEWLLNNLLENVIPKVNAQLGYNPEEKSLTATASVGGDRWADDPDPIHNS